MQTVSDQTPKTCLMCGLICATSARVCGRCGFNFVSTQTTAGPATASPCPSVERQREPSSGLGGWLAWFGIGVIATPVLLAATILSETCTGFLQGYEKSAGYELTWDALKGLPPGTLLEMFRAMLPYLAVAVVSYGALVAWSVRVAVLFYRRRFRFPTEWKWLQVALVGATLLGLELTRLGGQAVTDQDIGELFRESAFALIVWLYVARSQRIRHTFVR